MTVSNNQVYSDDELDLGPVHSGEPLRALLFFFLFFFVCLFSVFCFSSPEALLQNLLAEILEIWYVALFRGPLPNCLKWSYLSGSRVCK